MKNLSLCGALHAVEGGRKLAQPLCRETTNRRGEFALGAWQQCVEFACQSKRGKHYRPGISLGVGRGEREVMSQMDTWISKYRAQLPGRLRKSDFLIDTSQGSAIVGEIEE
jgi:hypothetical protein